MAKKKTTEEFINEAILKHNHKYDYSKTEYKGNKVKVCIICPQHGEFWQTPDRHLHSKGCLKCAAEKRGFKRRTNFEDFVKKSNIIHKGKYKYDESSFTKGDLPTKIICPIHGEFWQLASSHMNGHGCPQCKKERLSKLRQEEFGSFIKKTKKVHGDKYDYSEVKYKDSQTKVLIICPKHGEFWQIPNSHLMGKGCPKCKQSHLEAIIERIIRESKIEYITQKKFEWLINEKNMCLDFFLPQYNIAIECQGEQHIYKTKLYGKSFEKTKKRDLLKNTLCKQHNIKIIYIFSKHHSKARLNEDFNNIYDDALFIEDIIKDNKILLNRIKEQPI